MHLSGPQLRRLRDALESAFPAVDDFDQMLKDRLDSGIADYTAPKKRSLMYAAVLEQLNAEEHLVRLVAAARAERPANTELRRVAEELGLSAETPPATMLERIVQDSNSMLDVHAWLTRLTAIEVCVCRIVRGEGAGATALGTGFLVGPAAVLTNYHVIEEEQSGAFDPANLRAQFDYHMLADGSIAAGTYVPLAQEWLIDHRPYSEIDFTPHPIEVDVEAGRLDYAVLRLQRPFGSEPVGPVAHESADHHPRGWIDLENPAPKAAVDSSVFIVQHALGLSMKLALGTKSVIGYTASGRRIRYRTNTLNGSSGSPVFNENLEILALHHAGDPNWVAHAEYNEGIPIPAVTEELGPLMAKLAE